MTEEQASRRAARERGALGLMALGAAGLMLWVALPMGVGIFLGALNAFMLQPLYDRLVKKWRRTLWASVTCLGLSVVTLVGSALLLSYLFVNRGYFIARQVIVTLQPGGEGRQWLEHTSARLTPYGINAETLLNRLREAVAEVAGVAANVAATLAEATFNVGLTLFFVLLTTHFVLHRWSHIALAAEAVLPISPRHTRALIEEFRSVGRATLLGSVLTGVAQGVFAAAIFFLCGAPEAAFFGAATAVCSLLPGVGTLLVWVPMGFFLVVTGHPGAGVVELVLSALTIVGVSDYVIRPRLVGSETMPPLFTFAALFGGAKVFGLIGLLLGPLLMAVAVALLRLYAEEATRG